MRNKSDLRRLCNWESFDLWRPLSQCSVHSNMNWPIATCIRWFIISQRCMFHFDNFLNKLIRKSSVGFTKPQDVVSKFNEHQFFQLLVVGIIEFFNDDLEGLRDNFVMTLFIIFFEKIRLKNLLKEQKNKRNGRNFSAGVSRYFSGDWTFSEL